ncbi:hypothetical protein C8R43DRAFT_1235857 [Mycena crocata]|nr:hypothetical protein C8R43DRAFT_1235857 [Mycena crocata]
MPVYLPTAGQILAALRLACAHCHTVLNLSSGLLMCAGGCGKLVYCDNECQKVNWRHHKYICKAIQLVERDTQAMSKMVAAYPSSSQNDLETLDRLSLATADQTVALCEKLLKRSLMAREIDIIAYEPKCLACARTNMILRTEAGASEAKAPSAVLAPCGRCKISFGCCEEHWNVALPMHEAPCNFLPGTVSQCDMNLQKQADAVYGSVLTSAQEKDFMWRIILPQPKWTQLTGNTWEDVIGLEVASASVGTAFEGHVPACIRRISSIESTAFTILYALEHLNTNAAWAEKSVLTVNILIGSPLDFMKEVEYTYEAILHRAPKVKKLIFYFFPPKPIPGQVSQVWTFKTCGDCTSKARGIVAHLVVTRTFESFVYNEDELFVQPDLFIATNTAMLATDNPALWRRTIALLVDRHIPNVVPQSHGQRTAQSKDATIMRECGAELVPSLTGVKNPFGDMKMNPNFDRVHGFHSHNAWFAGAFR